MKDDDFNAGLAAELFTNLHLARHVRFQRRAIPTFTPQPHDCHNNVDRWCAVHPECKPVRGWLVFQYPLARHPVVRFQPHSVIEDGGRLVDLTPREGSDELLFLPHPDGNEMFMLTLSRRQISTVTHKLSKEEHDG